jgi:hypothetical protein
MIDIDERITTGERYARATNSSDLSVLLDQRCDADKLLAAGWAASGDPRRRLALTLYRMAVRGDMEGRAAIVEEASNWVNGRMQRKGQRAMPRTQRQALVIATLTWWLKPTCAYCSGRMFVEVEDTGRLSTQACPSCHGTGKTPIARVVPPPFKVHAMWLGDELDRLVLEVVREMSRLLAAQMPDLGGQSSGQKSGGT